jgi:holliday junction DNA helicase RuvA
MIAYIEGQLETKKEKFVVIAANGIGYKIFASHETLSKLPAEGEKTRLFTVLHVREDAMELYGFADEIEKSMFELLNTISGIGPKMAMNILGASGTKMLAEAIAEGNEDVLTKVSGVGRKTAAKIIMELKDKVREEIKYTGSIANAGDMEVREALVTLGYGERQAHEVLRKLPAELTKVEERIKAALKMLGR